MNEVFNPLESNTIASEWNSVREAVRCRNARGHHKRPACKARPQIEIRDQRVGTLEAGTVRWIAADLVGVQIDMPVGDNVATVTADGLQRMEVLCRSQRAQAHCNQQGDRSCAPTNHCPAWYASCGRLTKPGGQVARTFPD